jgi:hypothetical protein
MAVGLASLLALATLLEPLAMLALVFAPLVVLGLAFLLAKAAQVLAQESARQGKE